MAVVCLVAGALLPTDGLQAWLGLGGETAEEATEEPGEGYGGEVFDVTLTAQASMQLRRGYAEKRDYTRFVSVPGVVRERPAVSNLQASSKMAGIVRKVYVDVGQSVREGDKLVDLELTGDDLAESQSVLLDSHNQLEIVRSEIARIKPVAASGGVARKNLLEKQYEEKRLAALFEAKRQELLAKGLTEIQLQEIVGGGQLVRMITISVPVGIRPAVHSRSSPLGGVTGSGATATLPVTPVRHQSVDPWVYSIETLGVNPGSMVQPGQPLCDLAYHETLLIEGQAYERDLGLITQGIRDRQTFTVELGDDENPELITGLPILYVDNHVDPESQTVRFYIELDNTVTSEVQGENGALFRSWKLRPDQRGHIRIPATKWKEKMVLPAEAVAKDGLDYVCFQHLGEHDPIGEAAHSEFRKIAISVLYRDRRHVVAEPSGKLSPEKELALNNAFLLLLEANKTEGGGHHHHHEH
ncbi:MAG: efflux RND transporter periplasmic adaptor subunit [Aureliella sp.]